METFILTAIIFAAACYVGYVLTGAFRGGKNGECRCTSAVCPYAGKKAPPCGMCPSSEKAASEELLEITTEPHIDDATQVDNESST